MLWRHRRRDGFVWKKHVKTIIVDRKARRAARMEAFGDAGARAAGRAQAAAGQGAKAAASGMMRAGAAIASGARHVGEAARERMPAAREALEKIARRLPRPDLKRTAAAARNPMSLMQAATYVVLALGGAWAITALVSSNPDERTRTATKTTPTEVANSGGTLFSLFQGTETITGSAAALDGDTLRIEGRIIRLAGIDAPELTQRCRNRRGRRWRCGAVARRDLARRVRRQTLSCTVETGTQDRIGSGTCRANDKDVSIALLERGRAFATDEANAAQKEAVRLAKDAKRGVWSGEAELPAEYRKRRWDRAAANTPDGCPIKGVHLSRNRGKVFITPWSPSYRNRRVRPSRGDQWFCAEDEALQAGFSPA